MEIGIYCYKDLENEGKIVYIGKDSYITYDRRHYDHLKPYNYNQQQINRVLQNNLDRYEYEVLEKWNPEDYPEKSLNDCEIKYIAKYKPLFNFTKGGDGLSGYKMTDEHKRKMSEARKGKKLSKETKNKLKGRIPWNKGKTGVYSEETKKKMSESMKGRIPWNKGKTHSDETKKKMSELKKGKKFSFEQRLNFSSSKNKSGYYRVSIMNNKSCKQGFTYLYSYYEDNKQKSISSTNIKKLEEKVKEKGLEWYEFPKE